MQKMYKNDWEFKRKITEMCNTNFIYVTNSGKFMHLNYRMR